MRYIKDEENIYLLKASMSALIQMDELGLTSEIFMKDNQPDALGVRVLFDVFRLLLSAGQNRDYTKTEALDIFQNIVEYNGMDILSKVIDKVIHDDTNQSNNDNDLENNDSKTEDSESKKMDKHMIIVHFSASWGISVDEVYKMTPAQISQYGKSFNENTQSKYDIYRFTVFEGIRNAMSDKVKEFKPLFTKKKEDTKGPVTDKEREILKNFLKKNKK